jgi:galactokinase
MNSKKLTSRILSRFKAEFDSTPILINSPGRINIIGEHIDYNGGMVLPAAINKSIICALQKTNLETSTIIALDVNEAYSFKLSNITPLKENDWRNYILGVISGIQNLGITIPNFNLVFAGTIPSGAGLSSSAALENSVIFGLNSLFNLQLSKKKMIQISQEAEHKYVGVKCGIMDQFASMFGETDKVILLNTKTLKANTFSLKLNEYEFLLINTNLKHSLSESAYNQRRATCEQIASLLNVSFLIDVSVKQLQSIQQQISKEDYQKGLFVIEENERTKKAVAAIQKNNLPLLGSLLYASHKGLQNQYNVSCSELDFLVLQTQKYKQILGARMIGGGFGGCTINLISKQFTEQFKSEIAKSYYKKFKHHCDFYTITIEKGTHLI